MRALAVGALTAGGLATLLAIESTDLSAQRQPPIRVATTSRVTLVQTAIDRLGGLRLDARFRINAVVGPGPLRSLWVVGELQSTGGRPDEFMQGAKAAIEVTSGGTSATTAVTLKSGELSFLATIALPAISASALDVRVRLESDEGAAEPLSDDVRLDMASAELRPLMFRRGVTTGNRLLPAARPKFSRTERVQLDFPVGPGPRDGKPGRGRVLDRGGLATVIPVAVAERTDAGTGQRWITADVALAALSPGDYVVEVIITRESTEERVLTPIRVVR